MRRVVGSLAALFIIFTFVIHASAQSLTDIDSHWAKKEIETLNSMGIVSGYEDGKFRPYTQVTRGQFVAYLVRALDLPAGESAFPDVPASSRLYKEIAAGKKAGLISGNAKGLALADAPVTRSDVAAMLDRAMQLKGDYTKRQPLTFTDASKIGKYAYGAVERMSYYGLIKGTADNRFEPQKVATRGEAVVFIYRMMDKLDLLGGEQKPQPSDNQEVVIPVNDQQSVKVRMNTKGVPLIYNKKVMDDHVLSTDSHYYYYLGQVSKPLGSLQVTLRKLDNGDTFVFTKFIHNGSDTYSASVSLPFEQANEHSIAKYSSFGTVNQSHHSVFGVDKTSHPVGILSVKNGTTLKNEMMVGKNYISLQRQTNYSNGQRSVIRELLDEKESYEVVEDTAKQTITAQMNMEVRGKAISESWLLLSGKPLFENASNRDDWFKRTIAEYISINNWLTADGAYTKLPWSIEPAHQMGYGRNVGRLQGGVYLTVYNENKERYLRDLVVNSLADLDTLSGGALTAGENPIFETEYTSSGLKEQYGLTAPYIDTRHNENAALFLKNTAESLNISQLKGANLRYADFLVSQKGLGNIIPVTASSYLIADYYKADGPKVRTHASLNHTLGEMRFLLETYKQTKNNAYLTTARQLKAGVENLNWARPNGDLWYQYNGNGKFGGNDYENLTLMDLLLSQNIFAEVDIPRSKAFDAMIKQKTKYLVDNEKPIIPAVVQLLREQGFGAMINEAYPATTRKADVNERPKDTLDLLAE
ncbi:S-layer homology domain-containing protein [Pseudobacillus sp. FSL P4-0506]|uniref:S-layer homology domain-containing protein n=1 Tax=Pseudobacillus sp. FSL P4-0506 TaxID=2921576 RepID=UPI0030FD09D2